MSNFKDQFSSALSQARKSAGLTQQEMAEKLCVTRSTYAYYEGGRVLPDLEALAVICRALGVSADSLLGLG